MANTTRRTSSTKTKSNSGSSNSVKHTPATRANNTRRATNAASTSSRNFAANSRRKTTRKQNVNTETQEEVILFLLFAFFVFVLLCMINVVKGFLGEGVKHLMLGIFGLIGYIIPLGLLVGFLFKLSNKHNPIATIKLISAISLLFSIGVIICQVSGIDLPAIADGNNWFGELYDAQERGGVIFGLCAILLYKALGKAGTWFVCIILIIVAILLITEKNFLKHLFYNYNPFINDNDDDYYDGYNDDYNSDENYKALSVKEDRDGQLTHKLSREEIIARDEEKRNREKEEKRKNYELRQQQEEEKRLEKERRIEEKRKAIEERRKAAEEKEKLKDLKDDQRILNTTIKGPESSIYSIGTNYSTPLIEEKKKVSKDDIHEITLPKSVIDSMSSSNNTNNIDNELFSSDDDILNNNNNNDIDNNDSFSNDFNLEKQIIESTTILESEKYNDLNELNVNESSSDSNNIDLDTIENNFVLEQPDIDSEKALNNDSNNDLNFDLNDSLNDSLNDGFIKDNDDFILKPIDDNESKGDETRNNTTLKEDVVDTKVPNTETTNLGNTDKINISSMPDPITEKSHEGNEKPEDKPKPKPKAYKYPHFDLLKKNTNKNSGDSDEELKTTALKLQKTLKTFGVEVQVSDISQGPSVTRYELTLAEGTKVSKIVNLQDDIKLNLAAQDIRIEAPIPGKAAVGIEIPNKTTSSVLIRDLLETKEFDQSESKITFAVGKDISGKTIVADIAKMPHMLIAGSTGSGKSVCINTLIMSILYKADPKDVKLIMIDPKVVELSVYNGIPHLLLPVVTDPRKASAALQWAVNEMTKRYNAFATHSVRDLKGYNQKILDLYNKGETEEQPKPQIVVIVDELADLMMVASKEVEDSICRLAQLARAAGIHLIIATQRPSVDVITGLIKANMPSRVAFKVSSGVDSRTILDMVGAEKLLGKGDMLFYPQGYSKPLRTQGAFVSDDEVTNVVEFLKGNAGEDVYDKDVEAQISGISNGGSGNLQASGEKDSDLDSYFEEACRLVVEKEKASSGMLQRVYKIGFNRAARIIDQMESYGVVGPEEGTKPRKVLMTISELEDLLESIY